MLGVWTAPVTAQVMMTLRGPCLRGASLRETGSPAALFLAMSE